MDFDALKKHAQDPIWDEEVARLAYAYPLPPELASMGERFKEGIPKGELYPVGPFLAARSPQSHIGPFKWATDLLIPDGTMVLAAQDGVIIEVKEEFEEWGDREAFSNHLNYLTIEHAAGEFSQYCHLGKNSVHEIGLSIGRSVRQGQPIAKVGKTGWTDRDHLHFIVFRGDTNPRNPFGFKSLKVSFS